MSEVLENRECVVIGAGPAGYPAAFRAADLGLDVVLIDPEKNPGGVCLHRGCIPSKALLHAASLVQESREAGVMGITFQEPEVNIDALRIWKEKVVTQLTGGLGFLAKKRNITFLKGRAKFNGAKSVEVTADDGTVTTVSFKQAIIAAGSEPVRLPFLPDSDRVMDSTGALALPDLPGSMLVLGGGYIGLELGQAYAQLGSKVTVAEMMPSLIPGCDPDLVAPLTKRLKKLFSAIKLETKVTAVEEKDAGLLVTFVDKENRESQEMFDKVLVAVGRRVDMSGLGLEHTGVQLDDRGFVKVNEELRTADPSIFAVGDCAGNPMLAHKGTHEAKIAAEVIAGKKSSYDVRAIPAVVFTDPQIAWCGITEAEAEEKGLSVKTAVFPWAASGRAVTLNRTEGLTKIIADADTGTVLGVGISGQNAGEMIGEAVLAVEMGSSVEDIALTVHAHPTLSETIMEAAELFEGDATHFIAKRKRG